MILPIIIFISILAVITLICYAFKWNGNSDNLKVKK